MQIFLIFKKFNEKYLKHFKLFKVIMIGEQETLLLMDIFK